MKKIIANSGYYGTGSSVVSDFLKEFGDKIYTAPNDYEVRFLHDPYGVAWLEAILCDYGVVGGGVNLNAAINLFLQKMNCWHNDTMWYRPIKFWSKPMYQELFKGKFYQRCEEYIDDLVDIKYTSEKSDYDYFLNTKFDTLKVSFLNICRKFNIPIKDKTINRYEVFLTNKDFHDKTKKFLNTLLDDLSDKKYICLEAFILPYAYERFENYFDDLSCVVVDRDPRDWYVLHKKIWHTRLGNLNVKQYIEMFKKQRSKTSSNAKLINIKFENCIYDYDETMSYILKKLDMSHLEQVDKHKFFNPEVSIKNTQVYKNFVDLKDDIDLIEKELEEFCYKFPFEVKQNIKEVF